MTDQQEEFTAPFSHAQMQMVKVIVERSRALGLSFDDLDAMYAVYVAERKAAIVAENVARTAAEAAAVEKTATAVRKIAKPVCAVCGFPAMVLPVNNSAATMIGGDYTRVIMCRNPQCWHVEYN